MATFQCGDPRPVQAAVASIATPAQPDQVVQRQLQLKYALRETAKDIGSAATPP
jgi:hypothetical protein